MYRVSNPSTNFSFKAPASSLLILQSQVQKDSMSPAFRKLDIYNKIYYVLLIKQAQLPTVQWEIKVVGFPHMPTTAQPLTVKYLIKKHYVHPNYSVGIMTVCMVQNQWLIAEEVLF